MAASISMAKSRLAKSRKTKPGNSKGKVIARPVSPFMLRVIKKRSWIASITLAGLFVAASVSLMNASNAPLLPIKSIALLGQLQHLSGKDVEQAVSPLLQTGFFGVNVNAIKKATEQLPWAQSVSVRRVWPDQLQIAVTEQKAVARWGDKAVLNAAGDLFYPPAQAMPTEVVQLKGPHGAQRQLLKQYKELQNILADQGLKIKQLALDPRRAMEIELTNDIHLMLGKVRSVSESSSLITRFAQAYGKVLVNSNKKIESVDLRYANGFAVQWVTPNNSNKKTPAAGSQTGKAPKDVFYG